MATHLRAPSGAAFLTEYMTEATSQPFLSGALALRSVLITLMQHHLNIYLAQQKFHLKLIYDSVQFQTFNAHMADPSLQTSSLSRAPYVYMSCAVFWPLHCNCPDTVTLQPVSLCLPDGRRFCFLLPLAAPTSKTPFLENEALTGNRQNDKEPERRACVQVRAGMHRITGGGPPGGPRVAGGVWVWLQGKQRRLACQKVVSQTACRLPALLTIMGHFLFESSQSFTNLGTTSSSSERLLSEHLATRLKTHHSFIHCRICARLRGFCTFTIVITRKI